MPQYHAVPVTLTAAERKTLKKRVRRAKTAHRDWLRAQIVLAAARGRASARIAADLHVSVDTVRKWGGRFAERGLDGLKDLPRSGRPQRWVIQLAARSHPPKSLRSYHNHGSRAVAGSQR